MHILVATGGSAHSQAALQQCLAIATAHVVEVTILTVTAHEEYWPEAEAILAEAVAYLQTAVSTLHTKIGTNFPDEEILAEAAAGRYDLLILGDRPHHNLLTRLIGSVAQRVMAQTKWPLLLAKSQARPLHRILVCDSGSQMPNLAERLAARLPALLQGAEQVTILHVMSQISAAPGVPGQHLRAEARELMYAHAPEGAWLAHDIEVLHQVDVAATPKVRHGLVVEEILAEAADGRYDLVVIGAHAHEGWQRFLLEDVSAQIVLKADLPVLVIP